MRNLKTLHYPSHESTFGWLRTFSRILLNPHWETSIHLARNAPSSPTPFRRIDVPLLILQSALFVTISLDGQEDNHFSPHAQPFAFNLDGAGHLFN